MKTTIRRSNKGKAVEYWEVKIADDLGRLVRLHDSRGFWMELDYYPEEEDSTKVPAFKNYKNSDGIKWHLVYNTVLGRVVRLNGNI